MCPFQVAKLTSLELYCALMQCWINYDLILGLMRYGCYVGWSSQGKNWPIQESQLQEIQILARAGVTQEILRRIKYFIPHKEKISPGFLSQVLTFLWKQNEFRASFNQTQHMVLTLGLCAVWSEEDRSSLPWLCPLSQRKLGSKI